MNDPYRTNPVNTGPMPVVPAPAHAMPAGAGAVVVRVAPPQPVGGPVVLAQIPQPQRRSLCLRFFVITLATLGPALLIVGGVQYALMRDTRGELIAVYNDAVEYWQATEHAVFSAAAFPVVQHAGANSTVLVLPRNTTADLPPVPWYVWTPLLSWQRSEPDDDDDTPQYSNWNGKGEFRTYDDLYLRYSADNITGAVPDLATPLPSVAASVTVEPDMHITFNATRESVVSFSSLDRYLGQSSYLTRCTSLGDVYCSGSTPYPCCEKLCVDKGGTVRLPSTSTDDSWRYQCEFAEVAAALCVKASLDVSGSKWSLNDTWGTIGCKDLYHSIFDYYWDEHHDKTNDPVEKWRIVPRTQPVYFSNMTMNMTIRDGADPYLTALALTDSTLSWGRTLAEKRTPGVILMSIGGAWAALTLLYVFTTWRRKRAMGPGTTWAAAAPDLNPCRCCCRKRPSQQQHQQQQQQSAALIGAANAQAGITLPPNAAGGGGTYTPAEYTAGGVPVVYVQPGGVELQPVTAMDYTHVDPVAVDAGAPTVTCRVCGTPNTAGAAHCMHCSMAL